MIYWPNMSNILIYHHLGLGDHIMCHGIVREYCKKYDRVGIFCKPHNYPSVAFMFRDLANLTIIKGDDRFARKFIFWNRLNFKKSRYNKVIYIGFKNLDYQSSEQFEKQFYRDVNLPLATKWEMFHIDRDRNKEQALFDRVALPARYAFVHDDKGRNYGIDESRINPDLKIFRAKKELTDNVCDYLTIIERAEEIHVIDSSFMFLIDCLKYDNPNQKLYIHRYARENTDWLLPILKKNWQILK